MQANKSFVTKMHTRLKRYQLIIFLTFSVFSNHHLEAQKNKSQIADPNLIATQFNLKLQHTTLVVSDFNKSKAFYVDILGLEDLNKHWLPENQMFLSLGPNLELHMGEVEGVKINPNNFNHFAISTKDLDGYLAYLLSRGIPYSDLGGSKPGEIYQRPDGVRQTFIQDPDGYWIELNDAN